MGRAVGILDQLSPDEIDTFVLTNLNAEMPLLTYEISRSDFNTYKRLKITEPLLSSSEIKATLVNPEPDNIPIISKTLP